ncbi:aminotransferase class III-fold pyridoxal phosphate-dependent enzyme [Nonomuraea indica]|uniref:Aminotransferase class III-fold pyridoxal phosphate-dependent enzyme n=1 Tax=Nonomuraea indica TaxID=1581193 RepID=A0ABW8A528_9ACTN
MSARPDAAPQVRNAMHDLLGQQWVKDLFQEVRARQPGSGAVVEEVRSLHPASHMLRPFLSPQLPPAMAEASGGRIVDVDGNEYIDCHLGFSTQSLHGHNPEPVVAYVRDRMRTGVGNGNLHPLERDLALLMREFVPHCEQFAFLNSGTEAVRTAVKLARAHTGRRMVAKFEGAVHGSYDLAVHNSAFWYHGHPAVPFPPIGPDGVGRTPFEPGVPTAGPDDLLVLPNDTAAAVELIERHAAELACVLAEPALSAFPFPEVTVPTTREVALTCRRLGVPVVLDEVLTGFRFGPGGAARAFDIPADLYCYGKVMSGLAIPISAVGGRAEIMERARTSGRYAADLGGRVSVAGTHTANHLALCASYATLSLLRDKGEEYYAETRAKVTLIRERLAVFRAEHGVPLWLTGFGDFMGGFQLLPKESFTDYREYAGAVNPALSLLSLMLRLRGVYTLNSPVFFTGGAHDKADIETVVAAVTDSMLTMRRNGFPLDLTAGAAAR